MRPQGRYLPTLFRHGASPNQPAEMPESHAPA